MTISRLGSMDGSMISHLAKEDMVRGWRRLRNSVLMRDNHLCQECLKDGIYTHANEVDHIKPKYLGGGDSYSNLQAICSRHHKIKTLKEARAARRGND